MKLYLLQRKDKNGFKETIWAWQRCKGWKTIKVENAEYINRLGITYCYYIR